MNSILTSCFCLILTSLATAAATDSVDPRANLEIEKLVQTCKHYQNRARFKERGASQTIDVVLADSCTTALMRLRTHHSISPYEAKRARVYLERLADYKALIIRMNSERFAEELKQRPRTSGSRPFGRPRMQVSTVGEFLIARHMGLLDLLYAWANAANYEKRFARRM